MLEKLARIEERYEELNRLMADPDVVMDHERLAELAREQAGIEEVVQTTRRYRAVEKELSETRELLEEASDPEMIELARSEAEALEREREELWQKLRLLLLPRDPNDEKNVIVEIRAGAGGEEAGLFAADLYRMYTRYAEARGWKTDLLSAHSTGIGGFKEVIFQVQGRGAYSRLKYESGVHRVQRVPETEAQGRIHTSTATVAVLPEMDEVEVSINPDDLEIEVYRSSGPGGQHMQKNATAVRITHKPTGLVVSCENERSQTQNRLRALAVLRARLYDMESQQQMEEQDEARRRQVGSGERSEKIRTYNFPQNRVTDHRIGKSLYRLEEVLNGDLDEFIDELATTEQAERLQALGVA
ncbi:MAG: peptide chain release factor 1 [Anaerolineae bacterium]|nr:peptide chain release factor 1 [Anaerolineae bacterium]